MIQRMAQMAYARIRQLAAHEIGHTLGLSHNYVASTHERASVMDYPPPLVAMDDSGRMDLGNAYATGIGEWDKVAINWGYREFPPGTDEKSRLDAIVTDAAKRGLIFLTDEDARPLGSAHPANHLWDSGVNAVTELDRILKIRAAAIASFDERRDPPRAADELAGRCLRPGLHVPPVSDRSGFKGAGRPRLYLRPQG